MALSELENQLLTACKNGWLNIAKTLVDQKNIDPSCRDEDGDTPLHLACLNGHTKIARFLAVDKQCDAESRNNNGSTPLHYASAKGYLRVVKLLVHDIQCDPTTKGQLGRSPLHHACQEGYLQIAKYFIEDVGVDPLCPDDESGATPLHLASQYGHTNLMRYLTVERQIDAEYRDYYGDTPLHRAARYGQLDVVKLLVDEGHCDPMCTGQLERTPLHHACEKGHLNVVKYLTDEQNVDTSPPDTDIVTPLHMAALNGHAEVVKHLRGVKKCDPAPMNLNGETPYDFAYKKYRHRDIAHYLEKHGGGPRRLYTQKPHTPTRTPISPRLRPGDYDKGTFPYVKPVAVGLVGLMVVMVICGAGYQYVVAMTPQPDIAREVPQPETSAPHTAQTHTDPSPSPDTPTDCHSTTDVLELTKALTNIGNWEILCQNLRVKDAIISTLRVSGEPPVNKKRQCLRAYIYQGDACWEEVIRVVANDPFYKVELARDIAKKHGIDHARPLADEL